MKCLANLKEGAKLCLANSERLLDDAETLFYKEKYHTCFLLAQLCLEELAKGYKLIEKEQQGAPFTKMEWIDITRGKGHKKKLEYLQKVEDKWKEECLGSKLPYPATSKQDKEEYANFLLKWRMDALYVDYDFSEGKWINPLENPVFGGASVYYLECSRLISHAKTLVGALAAKLHC